MPNKIVETNISPTNDRLVDSLSRYKESEIIYYGDQSKMTFKTYKRQPILISPNDRFTVIKPEWEYRPDLVSLKAYGTTYLWWQIMEDNNIFDIFDFKSGRNIRIPNII